MAKKNDRLDRLLREEVFTGAEFLSRQAWDWLLENGRVEVDGRKCLKSGTEVKEKAMISVSFPAPALGLLKAEKGAELLWNDGRLALFFKPCGISSVPLYPWDSSTFANEVATTLEGGSILSALDFAALSAPPALEGGLLQRLDGDTSGIMCVALSSDTKCLFRQLFSASAVEKTYLALVAGSLDRIEGDHELWLNTQGGAKVRASLSPPLKAAQEPSRLSVNLVKVMGKYALVNVRTRQGARHIVRAGMAALGAPLIGDAIYGGEMCVPFHQLHAQKIRLLNPASYPGFPSIEARLPLSFLDSQAVVGLQ